MKVQLRFNIEQDLTIDIDDVKDLEEAISKVQVANIYNLIELGEVCTTSSVVSDISVEKVEDVVITVEAYDLVWVNEETGEEITDPTAPQTQEVRIYDTKGKIYTSSTMYEDLYDEVEEELNYVYGDDHNCRIKSFKYKITGIR